jgi:hypothetical protein
MTHRDGRDGQAGDDITSLPPLHLDVGDGAPRRPDDSGREAPWRRWAALTIAVAAGGAIGVVATNAADDAADRDRVDLVAGRPSLMVEQVPQIANPRMSGQFTLYNAGTNPVDVLGVELPGWSHPADAGAVRPVTADPGAWVTIAASFDIDCAGQPGPRIDVTVRTPAGERTLEIETPPINDEMRWAWDAGCSDTLRASADVTLVDVVSRDADQLVVEAAIHVSGLQSVTSIVSDVPGFTVIAPTPVDTAGSKQLDLTWQVSECGRATTMRDGQLTVTLRDGDTATDNVVEAYLDSGLLVELARFSAVACES